MADLNVPSLQATLAPSPHLITREKPAVRAANITTVVGHSNRPSPIPPSNRNVRMLSGASPSTAILNDKPGSLAREVTRAQRREDARYWTPIVSVFVGGVSLFAGTFVSAVCTQYGPGENGCIEYGHDLLGRGITLAGLVLLVSGLYVIFTPYFGWPFVHRKP